MRVSQHWPYFAHSSNKGSPADGVATHGLVITFSEECQEC